MAQSDQLSFLTGQNAEYIAELYARYVEDPASVDQSWQHFFAELSDEPGPPPVRSGGGESEHRGTQVIGDRTPFALACDGEDLGAQHPGDRLGEVVGVHLWNIYLPSARGHFLLE